MQEPRHCLSAVGEEYNLYCVALYFVSCDEKRGEFNFFLLCCIFISYIAHSCAEMAKNEKEM
jgi:hypothetical protein